MLNYSSDPALALSDQSQVIAWNHKAEELTGYSSAGVMWLESGNPESGIQGGTSWRGYVRHVQSDEARYFQTLIEMSDFMGQLTGVKGPMLSRQSLENSTKQ